MVRILVDAQLVIFHQEALSRTIKCYAGGIYALYYHNILV